MSTLLRPRRPSPRDASPSPPRARSESGALHVLGPPPASSPARNRRSWAGRLVGAGLCAASDPVGAGRGLFLEVEPRPLAPRPLGPPAKAWTRVCFRARWVLRAGAEVGAWGPRDWARTLGAGAAWGRAGGGARGGPPAPEARTEALSATPVFRASRARRARRPPRQRGGGDRGVSGLRERPQASRVSGAAAGSVSGDQGPGLGPTYLRPHLALGAHRDRAGPLGRGAHGTSRPRARPLRVQAARPRRARPAASHARPEGPPAARAAPGAPPPAPRPARPPPSRPPRPRPAPVWAD